MNLIKLKINCQTLERNQIMVTNKMIHKIYQSSKENNNRLINQLYIPNKKCYNYLNLSKNRKIIQKLFKV